MLQDVFCEQPLSCLEAKAVNDRANLSIDSNFLSSKFETVNKLSSRVKLQIKTLFRSFSSALIRNAVSAATRQSFKVQLKHFPPVKFN
jgi:hypothetical protein